MKRCPGCKKDLEDVAFYVRKKGYLSSRCKECTKAQVQANRDPDAHRAYMREWMREHRSHE